MQYTLPKVTYGVPENATVETGDRLEMRRTTQSLTLVFTYSTPYSIQYVIGVLIRHSICDVGLADAHCTHLIPLFHRYDSFTGRRPSVRNLIREMSVKESSQFWKQ